MEPIQLLILQLSRVTPLFASVSDEKVTETLQFHLLRRLGVPGISLTVFKRLLDDIQQSCLLPSSRDVTLSLLNAYCRQQTYVYESVNVNMESLSPLIPFSFSSASSAPNHALHPIGLFQTLKDKIFAEAGEAYVESTKLLSTFQIHFPNVNNTQLQTFCDAWSSPSSSLISLKSLQLFFFPLGFHIEMHSLLGMSLISSLRPHQSSISLLTACQTKIERQMVMRYGETVQLDDLVMYLEESMALPLAINSAVLLIHVFVLPHPRIYVSSSSLSSFLRMKEPVEKIGIPIEETIRIPSSQFLYAANLSDRWSPDVMLRYLTEALELTQYKGAFVLREISGADYILMSESMREILGSVEQRLHRLKLKEHADNLLLQVVSHAYTSARDEDIMHWNCFEIAGMLYENECPMAALLVARNLWSARELIRTSPETCQSKISLECPAEEAAALKLLAPFLWSLNTCEEYENCASDEKDEETSSSPPPLYTASSLLGQSLIIPEQDENSDSSSSNPSTPASVEINDTERIINTEQMITVAQSTSLSHAVELDASASLDASILVITEFSNSVSNKPEDESKAGGSIPPNLLDRPETVNFNELTPDQMSKNEDQYLNKQGITPAQEALLTEREISVPPSVANASKIDPSLELKLAALQLRLEAALATQRPNVPETTQLVNIVAPVSTINQKSVWVQLLSRVQHKGVSVNYDGKVDHVVARWMAMARAFIAESSSCSTNENMALVAAVAGVLRCGERIQEGHSAGKDGRALAVSFVLAFILSQVRTLENDHGVDEIKASEHYLKLVADGSLPIRDLPVASFRSALTHFCGLNLMTNGWGKVISALDTNDYKSITFSSMKLYSTRQHPLSAFGFTREESLFCVLCIFTVMTESILNQQRALHEVMSSLLGDFSTSRIPALDTLQGNEQHKTRESMDASLCKVFLSLTRRFFTRVKRLQNYSLSSFASLHPTSEMDSTRICWYRTLHLCKDNLEGICSHIVSGYMSSDECTSLAYDRLILLITRCICLRLKSLQQISQSSSSPSSSALVQGLLFRIEIAFNSSPSILSKYLKESCEELYAALMHQLGFPFLTSDELALGSLQQERIEQYVSQLLVPSLPSRLRSQIKENMTDISTIVRVETDIVLRRRLELLSRYISTLELSLGKIKEMLTALSELWNFVLDVGAEWEVSFVREKRNRRAKARVEQEVFKAIVALKEMGICETIEDEVESLFVAYSGGAIEDDEGAFRRMFQTIGTLESAQTQGKRDANILIGAIKKKVNAL